MSAGSSERKTDPASQQKLEKQRKRGVVSRAAETSNYIAQALVFLFILGSSGIALSVMHQSIDTALHSTALEFDTTVVSVMEESTRAFSIMAMPVFLLAATAGVIVTLIYQKGFVFAIDPIIPKPERMNPASFVKQIFGLRGWVELGAALLRLLIWAGSFFAVIRFNYDALLTAGLCGISCIAEVSLRVIFLLIVIAIVLFLFFAVTEMLIQTFLFGNDQKMTKSEVKRENKDHYGSSEVRSARKRFAKELESLSENVGRDKATLLLVHGDLSVALRYHPKHAPVPLLAAKGTDRQATEELLDYLRSQGRLVINSESVVQCMISLPLGSALPIDRFDDLLSAIVGDSGTS